MPTHVGPHASPHPSPHSKPLSNPLPPPYTQIQNLLDTLATGMERVHALLTWQDPTASALAVLSLLLTALAVAACGLPALCAAALLSDMLPPPLRTPFPAMGQNLLRTLPSRADRMA